MPPWGTCGSPGTPGLRVCEVIGAEVTGEVWPVMVGGIQLLYSLCIRFQRSMALCTYNNRYTTVQLPQSNQLRHPYVLHYHSLQVFRICKYYLVYTLDTTTDKLDTLVNTSPIVATTLLIVHTCLHP